MLSKDLEVTLNEAFRDAKAKRLFTHAALHFPKANEPVS